MPTTGFVYFRTFHLKIFIFSLKVKFFLFFKCNSPASYLRFFFCVTVVIIICRCNTWVMFILASFLSSYFSFASSHFSIALQYLFSLCWVLASLKNETKKVAICQVSKQRCQSLTCCFLSSHALQLLFKV